MAPSLIVMVREAVVVSATHGGSYIAALHSGRTVGKDLD